VKISLFHEPWWLDAVAGDDIAEVVVRQDREIVGRLPYVLVRRGPFQAVRMPPFTHMLGPVIEAGSGKPQTRLIQRMSLARSLIAQLPPHSFFHQHLDPSLDDGLALADGLAFQESRFSVAHQYTFDVDCRRSLDDLWAAMYQKTRNYTRRAEKEYSVRTVDDPKIFTDFYIRNVQALGRTNRIPFQRFPMLFAACRSRDCGMILGAFDDDTPVAMTFLVWGHGVMYYLLSTRASRSRDFGAVSLLIWSAMKRAHHLGLVLDLDGVYSSGTARFLRNFGGRIRTRLVVRHTAMAYGALQALKRSFVADESRYFT
jgi:hypothetical protein